MQMKNSTTQTEYPDKSMANSTDAVGKPASRPAWEILSRASDPARVADAAMRAIRMAWYSISRSDFSNLYRQVRRHTMCSIARLRGLYQNARYIAENNI